MIDQRPNTELEKKELIGKIWKLQEENEKLYHRISTIQASVKTETQKFYIDKISQLQKEVSQLRNKRAAVLSRTNDDLEYVCVFYGTPIWKIKGKVRRVCYIKVRCAYTYISRQKGMTYKEIGRRLNRDHASIINLVKKLDKYLNEEEIKQFNNYIYGYTETSDQLQGSDSQTPKQVRKN